jgi:hypothetical protein
VLRGLQCQEFVVKIKPYGRLGFTNPSANLHLPSAGKTILQAEVTFKLTIMQHL